MINKEAIELLGNSIEGTVYPKDGTSHYKVNPHIFHRALALLKAGQIPTSEFTKENRDFINDANRDFQANRVEGNCVIDYARALRELGKACKIIEQLQAQHEEDENIYKQVAEHNDILITENKKLLEGQAKVNK